MANDRCGNHPMKYDYGPEPYVFNIKQLGMMNQNFRTTLWTGKHMQLTLMSIPVGSDIGIEMHSDVDQLICIVGGYGKVYMGNTPYSIKEKTTVNQNCAVLVPAGTWHNIVNVGRTPLKLYSVYAPPQHPFGTIHKTKEDAQHDEAHL